MATKSSNKNLHKASQAKKDEFYTQLADIENELKHYKDQFRGKVVFCNCDDPKESNFVKYFSMKFEELGLKKLIATHYKEANLFTHEPPYKLEYAGNKKGNRMTDPSKFMTKMIDTGDFRSQECIELLKEADIVVTNPPFSLFREYVAQLVEYNKKFLIIGSVNAITYKECFKLIKENKMWLGASIHSGDREFRVPDDYPLEAAGYRVDDEGNKYIRVKGVRWFTNIDYEERHEDLMLYKKYTPEEYPKYDNYNAINVDKTADIPMDYAGAIGVPITFLDKYNPKQFELISSNDIRLNNAVPFKEHGLIKDKDSAISGKPTYVRIVIKNKKVQK
ncbi:MAG: adenine-specific methyltransferase EcoRI family protein [Candidatus Woesebacteria bacterium]|nr:adenine-specific methyltransferase EcoRI family protein [Candidatus Woesebacteria bacterium]